MQKEYLYLLFPEKKKETDTVSQKFENLFNNLFKTSDGKPKELRVNIGKEVGPNENIQDYLKTIKPPKK